MMFLNPFLLLGLAAASIPLLLHLLNLRKLRTVEFSSLRFLKELQKTRIRRLKLKQILLLILRTLLVIFAVLAFARPALQGTAGLPGAHAATTAVILIDDSFSMGVRDEQGPRLKQAKDAALDIVELLEDNDEAFLVSMTDLKGAVDAEPSRNREALRQRVNGMELSYRRADLDDALRVASTLLDRSTNINKEVYIITDAQRTNVDGAVDSLKIFEEATRIYVLPIGVESAARQANLGLDSIRILSSVFEQGKPVEIRAWIHNYSERDVENAVVAVHANQQRLSQTTVTIPAGATETVELQAPPKSAGLIGGYVELSGDDFDADNRRYFALRIPERIRVALVGASESTRYLGVVLGLSQSSVVVEQFGASALPAVDLAKYTTVVLVDLPSVSSGDATKLSEYLQSGGGLVIYGGPSTEPGRFNATLGSTLGIGLGAPVGEPGGTARPMTFTTVEREHPIFSGVFDPVNPGNTVETPNITRVLPATNGESVIRLSNGLPFMSEYRHGRGRVVYIGAPPTPAWSNFPSTGIFVPIALRSALYVGATGEAFVQATVGENVTVPLPGRSVLPEQAKIIPPSGRDLFVPVRQFPSGSSISFDNADAPGVYRVNAGGTDVALFTANMGSGESDLTPMTEEQLEETIAATMITPDNLTILESIDGEYGKAITESRFGLELWKYMLVLALICAFAEMFVGMAPKTPGAATA